MQTQVQQTWMRGLSQSNGEDCLAILRSLAEQLDGAMNAIVQRSLSSLQHSLYLQEISSSRLANLRQRSAERLKCSSGPEATYVDPDLALEIQAATDSVLLLTNSFSTLLKHSGDTLQLLSGFYRSYRGFAQPASESHVARPTWSCKI